MAEAGAEEPPRGRYAIKYVCMYARTLQNRREVISDLPLPIPLGQDRFKQFPRPGPEGLDLLPGIARGMVTGQIEPCIGN